MLWRGDGSVNAWFSKGTMSQAANHDAQNPVLNVKNDFAFQNVVLQRGGGAALGDRVARDAFFFFFFFEYIFNELHEHKVKPLTESPRRGPRKEKRKREKRRERGS
jgi:hypothetical protein